MKPHLRNGAAFAGLKIGLLGGSFNPAHNGHLAMSLYAMKQLKLDQVWWLVSPQNPLKQTADMAALDRRAAEARRVSAHPRIIVTTLESELGTGFTADTLRVLKRRFPQVQFVWLMGADNLRQIPRWKNWRDIFAAVPIAVFRRPGAVAGHGIGKAPISYGKNVLKAHQAGLLTQKTLPGWVILDNKLNYLSATQLRKDRIWRA